MFERFTEEARTLVARAVEHAIRLGHRHVGVEHITLALTTIEQGLVPAILAEAGAPTAALRAAILDRYRRAS
ncbi:MAG TPA: Clp protease N-terminal domain-containing protein [Streptosporangiaceae bacterium]|nr:Clp protease N-terminal domain-containing protein [Streptosporangiaceae bacterium]